MTLTKTHWYGIIAGALVLAMGFAGVNIYNARKAEKEKAMIFQLKQLRTAVQIFEMTQKAKPGELTAAMVVSVGGKGVPIQWTMTKDSKGAPLDPFGKPYQYDKKTGWVSSGSKGYESW